MAHRLPTAGPAAVLRAALALVSLTVLVLVGGCDGSPTSQLEEEAPFEVTHTDPAEAEQGDTVTVQIFGEGFAEGDLVSWEQDGLAVDLIVVNSVTFVSQTELLAQIRIALDTDIGLYDVAVTRKRKKGVGSEARAVASEVFEVKEYTPNPLGWTGLGVWAGKFSYARGINDHGVIVGGGGDGGSQWTAFSWSEDAGIVTFAGNYAEAMVINNHGQIAGYRGYENQSVYIGDTFVLENGTLTFVEQLSPPYLSLPLAINDAGTMVGWAAKDEHADPTWPIVWHRNEDGSYGPPVELPLREGEVWEVGDHQEASQAAAINASGDVVGTLSHGDGTDKITRAVLWRARADGSYEKPIELGGTQSQAFGINDAGWIVGHRGGFELSGTRKATLWHPDDYSKPIDLAEPEGTRSSTAYAVNDERQVAGTFRISSAEGPRLQGIHWNVDEDGSTIDVTALVPAPGHTKSQGIAINAAGWVVGTSRGYQPHRFEATLWRPDM